VNTSGALNNNNVYNANNYCPRPASAEQKPRSSNPEG
jgi:hypothetical protein